MDRSRARHIGASVALVGTLLSGLMMPRGVAAMQDVGPTQARVAGTGGEGLVVRAGPGLSHARLGLLPEGSPVQIVGGPSFDPTGRDWYLVTPGGPGGDHGWVAGEFLDRRVNPGRPDILAQSAAMSARTMSAIVTAYTWQVPGNGAHGSITRSGTVARWGTAAVDPSVIPLGSRLQIEGYDMVFVAEDTGGGVIGNRVEIFFPDEESAIRFGVQTLLVTILDQAAPVSLPASRP